MTTDPHAPSPSERESLPAGWVMLTVGDVHQGITGFAKVKAKNYNSEGAFPIIDQGASFIGGYCGDDSKVTRLGKAIVIFGDHTRQIKFVDFDFVAGADGTKLLQPEDFVLPKLFYYFLKAINLPGRGYGRHYKMLRDSRFPLPPLAEQVRIADKLDALLTRVEAGRERLERVPALLARLRQSILSAAVSGELTRDWRGGGDAEWEEKLLGEYVLNFDGGRIPVSSSEREKRKGEYPYYGASGIIDSIDGYTHDGKFLLIGEDGANLLTRSKPIAFIAEGKIWVNNHAHVLKAPEGFPEEFLEIFVNSIDLSPYVTGSAQPKLSQGNLNKIPIPLPPLTEQAEIVRRVESLFTRLDALERQYSAALRAYDLLTPALLQKAFRGELVPQDPSDESAAVLLERIRAQRVAQGPKKRGGRGAGRKATAQADTSVQGEAEATPRRRSRPRKVAAPAAEISTAASFEDAVRQLEAMGGERASGTRQPGLFGDDN